MERREKGTKKVKRKMMRAEERERNVYIQSVYKRERDTHTELRGEEIGGSVNTDKSFSKRK